MLKAKQVAEVQSGNNSSGTMRSDMIGTSLSRQSHFSRQIGPRVLRAPYKVHLGRHDYDSASLLNERIPSWSIRTKLKAAYLLGKRTRPRMRSL